MTENIKIASSSRFIRRKNIVRTIGLDTDIILLLIEDSQEFSLFRPKLFNRKNTLFINYKVFNELVGLLIKKYEYSQENAVNKIFSFLRANHITLLKKSQTNLQEVYNLIDSLKKQREALKNSAQNSDLEIIAIYCTHKLDCIMSRNSIHFEPFCRYLNVEFERPMDDVNLMFRQAFGWKNRKRN